MNLKTIKQTVEQFPFFSEQSLRWHLFHRDTNGLNRCVCKVGRKVLIDVDAFESWLSSKREG